MAIRSRVDGSGGPQRSLGHNNSYLYHYFQATCIEESQLETDRLDMSGIFTVDCSLETCDAELRPVHGRVLPVVRQACLHPRQLELQHLRPLGRLAVQRELGKSLQKHYKVGERIYLF